MVSFCFFDIGGGAQPPHKRAEHDPPPPGAAGDLRKDGGLDVRQRDLLVRAAVLHLSTQRFERTKTPLHTRKLYLDTH